MSCHEVAVARRGWRAAIRLLNISLLWIGAGFPVIAQTPPAMPLVNFPIRPAMTANAFRRFSNPLVGM